jgi:alkanesulfonate monooxygenase SsuD/methylene tetrahydromethanopterin reductase-like flavin-dependent oxidoreductase (luciferase family)
MASSWTERIGVLLMGAEAPTQVVAWARAAEAAGVGTVWVSEDCFYPSAFGLAAAAAVATRRVPIGIGVVNPYTRHPAVLAMEAATLSQLAPERVILGLGTSNRDWIEAQLGIAFREPRQTLRECVDIVQRLWGGERVTARGSCFTVNDAALQFKPAQHTLPVFLGMKSRRGLELAGEIADGVLLSGLPSPGHIVRARANIAAGQRRVGRTNRLTIAAYVATSIDDDGQRARDRVRQVLAEHLAIMHGQSILADAGLATTDTAVFNEHLTTRRSAAHLVTDALVRRFAIAGTPDECRAALAPLAAAGLDMPIAMLPPGGDSIAQTRRIVAELAEAWDEARHRSP